MADEKRVRAVKDDVASSLRVFHRYGSGGRLGGGPAAAAGKCLRKTGVVRDAIVGRAAWQPFIVSGGLC